MSSSANNDPSAQRRNTRSSSKANASILSFLSPSSTPSLSRKASNPDGTRRSSPLKPTPSGITKPSKPPSLKRKPSSSTASTSAGYAPPSRYAHISNLLTDSLQPGLINVFIGLNPGITTATKGHAYAHPSNLFWRLLHSSGCTGRRCLPSETHDLPQLWALGNTNIVERATSNGAELSKAEMDEGVAVLDKKVAKCKPMAVTIVGKSIWESIWRVWHGGKAMKKGEFKYGWQDDGLRMGAPERVPAAVEEGEGEAVDGEDEGEGEGDGNGGEGEPWRGARVFVATTTSGLAASMSLSQKEAIWRELGEWVEHERELRGLVGDRYVKDGEVITKSS